MYSHSLKDCIEKLKASFIEKGELYKLCLKCPSYRTRMKDEASMAIELEGKFFSITNRSLKRYFSIPKKLSSLSNDILLWMYKNNIVTMMKKDKIL